MSYFWHNISTSRQRQVGKLDEPSHHKLTLLSSYPHSHHVPNHWLMLCRIVSALAIKPTRRRGPLTTTVHSDANEQGVKGGDEFGPSQAYMMHTTQHTKCDNTPISTRVVTQAQWTLSTVVSWSGRVTTYVSLSYKVRRLHVSWFYIRSIFSNFHSTNALLTLNLEKRCCSMRDLETTVNADASSPRSSFMEQQFWLLLLLVATICPLF